MQDTRAQLGDLANASAAVRLFAAYCEHCDRDPAWRARFKVVCSCENMDQLGVPQLISSYNATPVVIRKTGSVFKGAGYIEKNLHIHKFSNMARQSIHLLTSRFGSMNMKIGFLVEGVSDAELPETLFACIAINKPQQETASMMTL